MAALARAYAAVHAALAAACWASVGFIALGISLDVILRNLRLGGLPWMLEASEYGLFLLTFLGAPWVLRLGAHVRVDIILSGVPRPAALGLEALGDAVGLAVSGVLLFYSGAVAARAHAEGARVIKEFIFPEWWIFALVAFSAGLLIVEFLVRLSRLARGRGLSDASQADRGRL